MNHSYPNLLYSTIHPIRYNLPPSFYSYFILIFILATINRRVFESLSLFYHSKVIFTRLDCTNRSWNRILAIIFTLGLKRCFEGRCNLAYLKILMLYSSWDRSKIKWVDACIESKLVSTSSFTWSFDISPSYYWPI